MPPLLTIKNLHTHFFLDEGVVRAIDGVEHGKQLLAGADERIDMLKCLRALELGGSSASGSHERLAGRIGDEMQMEIVFGLLHRILRGMLINRDKFELGGRRSGLQGTTARFIHKGRFGERLSRLKLKNRDKAAGSPSLQALPGPLDPGFLRQNEA